MTRKRKAIRNQYSNQSQKAKELLSKDKHSHEMASTNQVDVPLTKHLIDPVCNSDVQFLSFHHSFNRMIYYFCSKSCLDKFITHPERYLKVVSPAS